MVAIFVALMFVGFVLLDTVVHKVEVPHVPAPVLRPVRNPELRESPELVARDPYGAGWVCGIVSAYLDDGSGKMRSGDKAASWLESEFDRFREFISGHIAPDLVLGLTSLDGGLPEVGALSQLEDAAWNAFEAGFLRTP